jgi:hypothetical protein
MDEIRTVPQDVKLQPAVLSGNSNPLHGNDDTDHVGAKDKKRKVSFVDEGNIGSVPIGTVKTYQCANRLRKPRSWKGKGVARQRMAIVDTGATLHLLADESVPELINSVDSNRPVTGFNGNVSDTLSREGFIHMHFYDPQNAKRKGTTLRLPVSTMKGMQDNIISASKLVKALRFKCNLRPKPLKSDEPSSDDWEGFFKLEGGVLHRIPIYYNDRSRMWFMYYGVGATPSDAKRDGIDNNRQQHVDLTTGTDISPEYKEHARYVSINTTLDEEGDPPTAACRALVDGQVAPASDAPSPEPEPEQMLSPVGTPGGNHLPNDTDNDVVDLDQDREWLDNMPHVRPTQRPQSKRLSESERHRRLGHMGPCGKAACPICQQAHGTHRRVRSSPTVIYCPTPGMKIWADSAYWDVESREGYKYTICYWDDCTGLLAATHMAVRSTASDDIITWIDTIRTDPKMNCPDFCKILMLDKAGEWLKESPAFFQQCTERGISVTNPPAKSDKRMMSRGEMAVQIVKRHTRAIMMDTMLSIDRWPEAVDYACHTHNIVPITRKTQHDGSGIPPLVELSNSHSPHGYSLIECDRFRQYAHPPNTLCLVHVPGRHGSVANPSNSRYGLVVRCEGDIVKFRDPSKSGGPYFDSKNFSAIKLAPGISPHRFIGCKQPDGPEPKVCLPSLPEHRLPTMTIIKLNYLHSNEVQGHIPTVESTTTHGSACVPTFLTTDAAGRILEQRDNLLHPTNSWISVVPRSTDDDAYIHQERVLLYNALSQQPEWFIGRHAHKFFQEWQGICRATVTKYNKQDKLWTVVYDADGVAEEFDHEDMLQYVIDRSTGTAPPDGGAALKRNAEAQNRHEPVSMWGGDSQPREPVPEQTPAPEQYTDSSVDWHSTVDNETWEEIKEHCEVPSNQVREYLYWCKTTFRIGNDNAFKKDPTALYFSNPLSKRNRNPRFNAGCRFPIAKGETWDTYMTGRDRAARVARQEIEQAHSLAEGAFHQEYWQTAQGEGRHTTVMADITQPGHSCYDKWRQTGLSLDRAATAVEGQDDTTQEEAETMMDEVDAELWDYRPDGARPTPIQPEGASDSTVSATSLRSTNGNTPDTPQSYVDANGIPIAPKSTTDLYKRKDKTSIKMWQEALEKEWKGLCDRGVFEHDLTLQDLQRRGILPKKRIIGIRVIYEAKVKNGTFERAKARAVAQGFGFKAGRDYTSVFSAAPSLQANRLLSALSALLGWTRVTFDIAQAYLLGRAPPEQQYPMRYPEGWIRDQHRQPNGDERLLLCLGNIYGLPTSGRVYATERDRLLLTQLPRPPPEGAGWPCRKMEYETCMYEIIAKYGRILMTIHTDDCDCILEDARDQKELLNIMDKMFSMAGQPGIKVVDPGVMLGVHRTTQDTGGIRTVKIDQAAKIEEYWQRYIPERRGKRPPSSPYPVGDMHPILDNDGKVVGVTEDEADAVNQRGYKKITGEFLWITRNTGIAGMYAGSMMSKCAAKPSEVAWNAAVHAMH